MTQDAILGMPGKKHVKIYLLSKAGLPKKEVAALLHTNEGHVWNVLKEYSQKPEKAHAANAL